MILAIIIIALLGWLNNVMGYFKGEIENITSAYSIILIIALLLHGNIWLAIVGAILFLASLAFAVLCAYIDLFGQDDILG